MALAAELGLRDQVKHLQGISDAQLFRCYALADLAVMVSSREGFPMVTLEAMACGLPVIGTNNNENTQVIREGDRAYWDGSLDMGSNASSSGGNDGAPACPRPG